MAASTTSDMTCPDPSAHKHTSKLSEQASTAALYVTDPARHTDPRAAEKLNPLGPDGKLSSRGAAASLKYANAKDLPSFPTVGINPADSASKAAMLAKDYKMKELWQPEISAAGSKAALLAHRDGGKLDLWQPEASAAGNSAATLAMRTKGLSPEIDRGYTEDGRSKALLAATLSVSQNKKRSETSPAPVDPAYPDSRNSAANALNAATVSHRASVKMAPDGWSSEANQAARIKNSHINPEMFGDRPPVEIEEEEKRHKAALRASAVSVAKQMYDYQNRATLGTPDSAGQEGALAASQRQAPSAQRDVKQEALAYIHLQEAAHKLAQERLAKVDKNFEAARYREYYGYGGDEEKEAKSPSKKGNTLNRMSMHGRPREDIDSSDDEAQARRIRREMSKLNSASNQVDEKKRSEDRAKLMAAAEKRVHDRMHSMDEQVFSDTGKVPPALMEEWEAKARKRAQEERELQAAHPGMTHIGGGKFINQSEIEAIAAARLKPTLDALNENAEAKRARDEEIRLAKEEQERTKREEKQKHREEKDEAKRVKNEEKAAAKQQKEEEKARKAEEKRVAQEEKLAAQEEQRKAREAAAAALGGGAGVAAGESASQREDEKKTGTLGRFASKLKRRSKMVGGGEAPSDAPKSSEDTSAAPVAVVPTVEEPAETTADEPVAEKLTTTEEPATKSTTLPVLNVMSRTHTGDYTDAQPVHTDEPQMPNLERHITTIETSSEESDADDEDEELGTHSAAVATVAPVKTEETPLAGESSKAAEDYSPVSPLEETSAENKVQNVAVTEPFSADAVSGEGSSAIHTTGPHTTDIANILDPNVKQSDAKVEDNSSVLKDVTPDLQSTPVKATEQDESKKLQNNAAAVPAELAATPVAATPESSKLHKKQSSIAAADETSTPEEKKKGVRGFLSKLKNRSSRSVSKPESHKSSSSITEPKTSTALPAATRDEVVTPVAVAPVSTEQDGEATPTQNTPHIGTDGEKDVLGLDAPASPSSFKRGEPLPERDYDDVSSSGAEEEDVQRGRSGRKSRTQAISGKVLSSKKDSDASDEVRQSQESTDQFEEARDHFDESLAPPPAFAGQEKSASPSRGTKFQEDL